MRRTVVTVVLALLGAAVIAWSVWDARRTRAALERADELIAAYQDSTRIARAAHAAAVAHSDSLIANAVTSVDTLRVFLRDSTPIYYVELPLPDGSDPLTTPPPLVPVVLASAHEQLKARCTRAADDCDAMRVGFLLERAAAAEALRVEAARADTATNEWRRLIPRARATSFGVCVGPSLTLTSDLALRGGVSVTGGLDYRPALPRIPWPF